MVTLFGIQLALLELFVVFLDVAAGGHAQQAVAVVHLDGERLQGLDHLVGIGDDGLAIAGYLGQIMVFDIFVDAELDHFRIDQHDLELGRVLLVEQGSDDGVQTYRLALAGGTGYQQVRHLAQVEGEHFVHDGLAQHNRQVVFAFLEFLGLDQAAHIDDTRIAARHFDADGAFAGDGRDDTDAQGRKA